VLQPIKLIKRNPSIKTYEDSYKLNFRYNFQNYTSSNNINIINKDDIIKRNYSEKEIKRNDKLNNILNNEFKLTKNNNTNWRKYKLIPNSKFKYSYNLNNYKKNLKLKKNYSVNNSLTNSKNSSEEN
jgi:hypothetical protein